MTFQLWRSLSGVVGSIDAGRDASQGRSFLRCKSLLALLLFGLSTPATIAQAAYTAERQLNVQVGGTLSVADAGIPSEVSALYGRWNYIGGGIYATLDPHPRFGFELAGRQLIGNSIYERTCLAGPRYYKPYGQYVPYIKALLGRGTFKFPNNIGMSSFNMLSFGAGVDYRMSAEIHVRGEYEYQRWLGFSDHVQNFPGQLTPNVVSIGIAYHIR